MGHLLFIMFLIDLWMKIRSVNDHLLQPREAIAYIPGCLKSNSKSILFRAHDKISAILQKWSFSFCIICVCHIYVCMYVCMYVFDMQLECSRWYAFNTRSILFRWPEKWLSFCWSVYGKMIISIASKISTVWL